MDDSDLSASITGVMGHTAVPHVDEKKLLSLHGSEVGSQTASDVLAFARKWNWR